MVHSWHFPSQPSKRVRRRQEVIEPYHDGTKPEPKKNIPFPPTHISRTSSELQLVEDTQAAEWRDLCMFQRLVGGIRQREHAHRYLFDQQVRQVRSRFRNGSDQTTAAPPLLLDAHSLQTERCLANIYSTRRLKVEELFTAEALSDEVRSESGGQQEKLSEDDWCIGDDCYQRSMSVPPDFPILELPKETEVIEPDLEGENEREIGDVFCFDL